jgi:hypothetical protein
MLYFFPIKDPTTRSYHYFVNKLSLKKIINPYLKKDMKYNHLFLTPLFLAALSLNAQTCPPLYQYYYRLSNSNNGQDGNMSIRANNW